MHLVFILKYAKLQYYTQINQPCLQAATHIFCEVPKFLYYYKANIVECLNTWFPLYVQKNSHSTPLPLVQFSGNTYNALLTLCCKSMFLAWKVRCCGVIPSHCDCHKTNRQASRSRLPGSSPQTTHSFLLLSFTSLMTLSDISAKCRVLIGKKV